MAEKNINIKFPFKDNIKGFFLDTNQITSDAIKSDILHVLLTKKGERFFNPKFGTNLHLFLFEPNDLITLHDIKEEANASLSYSMPNIKIIKLDVEAEEKTVLLKIWANNSEDIFNEVIYIEVEI